MSSEMGSTGYLGRHRLQRLEILMDSVFAIVIVLLAAALPLPQEEGWTGNLSGFLLSQLNEISFAVIGMVMATIYWLQNNQLYEHLEGTDSTHAVLSLVQIFALLVYFYAIGLSMDFEDEPAGLALQSLLASLVGLVAMGSWWYASGRKNLLKADTDEETVKAVSLSIRAEPLTALITVPFAWAGPDIWGASWLIYPLVSAALNKRRARVSQPAG